MVRVTDSRSSLTSWAGAALAIAAAVVLGLLYPFPSSAEVYRWVDENGVTRYTTDLDRVPRHLRGRIRESRAAQEPPSKGEEARGSDETIPGPLLGTSPELRTMPGPLRIRTGGAAEVTTRAHEDLPGPLVGTPPELRAIPRPPRGAEREAQSVRAPSAVSPPQTAIVDGLWDIPGARPRPERLRQGVAPRTGTGATQESSSIAEGSEAELKSRVIEDRETLKELVSARSGDRDALLRNPELREIAERLRQLYGTPEPEPTQD